MAKVKIINLKHGDLVIIKGRKGIVGTVGGYAAEYGEDPNQAIKDELEKAKRIKYYTGSMYWVNQEAACICADPGYYEREKAKWSAAIPLEDGQLVWLDGAFLKIHYKGNYSDMCDFIAAEPVKVELDQLEDTRNGQTHGDF